jgi:hypothetical protein
MVRFLVLGSWFLGWIHTSTYSVSLAATELVRSVAVKLDSNVSAIDLDLGTLAADEKTNHKIALQNASDTPIRIVEVRPACSCVIASGGTGELLVGAETIVEVQLPSSRFVGKSSTTMTLIFGNGHQLVLRLISNVETGVKANAEVISFDANRKTATVTIESIDEDVVIQDVSIVGGAANLVDKQVSFNKVDIQLEKSSDVESLTDLIRVRYQKDNKRLVRDFPLQVKNLSEYRAVPRELVFSTSTLDSTLHGSIRLAARTSVDWITKDCLLVINRRGVPADAKSIEIGIERASERLVRISIVAYDNHLTAEGLWTLQLKRMDTVVFECPVRFSLR